MQPTHESDLTIAANVVPNLGTPYINLMRNAHEGLCTANLNSHIRWGVSYEEPVLSWQMCRMGVGQDLSQVKRVM